jgi:hypothetical protein
MAALTTQQEYDAIRLAIQAFATGASVYSASVDGMSVTYHSSQSVWLQDRERELAARLTVRNVRKRVAPDFTG